MNGSPNPPDPRPAMNGAIPVKTLRDELAMAAIPALIEEQCRAAEMKGWRQGWRKEIAMEAYHIADAMIEVRGSR